MANDPVILTVDNKTRLLSDAPDETRETCDPYVIHAGVLGILSGFAGQTVETTDPMVVVDGALGRLSSFAGETWIPAPPPPPPPPTWTTTELQAAPWSTSSMSLADAGVGGPAGTSGNAILMTATGGTYAILYQAATGLMRLRARVKVGTEAGVFLYLNTSSGFAASHFDLTAGALGWSNAALTDPTITALGDGWYEIAVTGTGTFNVGIGLSNDPHSMNNVAADIGETGLIYDFSIEAL